MNCELPPPVSNTTSDPAPRPSPEIAATYASRASSSPEITSTSIPERARTASTNAALFEAIRSPAVPTAAIASTPALLRLGAHAGDRIDGALDRLGIEPAGLLEALAEPRELGPVDDRPPLAVGAPLAEMELDRVRADVDDGVAPSAERVQRLEPARQIHVATRAEAELTHGLDHQCRVLRLDRDRADRSASVRTSVSSAMQPSIR